MKPHVEISFSRAARDVIGPAKVLPENAIENFSQPPCVSALDDKHVMKKPLPQQMQRWRRLAIVVCVLSMYLTLLMSLAWFVSSVDSGSSATLAVACDTLLAIISSGVVVWRFGSPEEAISQRLKKERRACFIIALCFITSAILVSAHCVSTLITDNVPQQPKFALVLASVNSGVYFLLFLAKFSLAGKLKSAALRADSLDALAVAATAFSVVISVIIVKEVQEDAAWFVGACVALSIAVVTFIYGLNLLITVLHERKVEENSYKPEERQILL